MAVQIVSFPSNESAPPIDRGAPVQLGVVAELLRGLNREQRRAVTHRDGPQLVIAGPGTGKTEVVTRRVAWLIATKRARPAEILALTFTDNAAEEMQSRVDLLVPYGQADAAINTFHAFGDRLLREHAFELGMPGDLRLITRAEAVVLLREHVFDLGLDRYRPLGDPTRFLGALFDMVQRAKDDGISPEQMLAACSGKAVVATGSSPDDQVSRLELATAYSRYQALLNERGLIDHGDQVWLPLRLLRERPAIRGAVADRYRYLLVDEFQDMNRVQLELVFELTGAAGNVTVVGDPDQQIYTFRGAATDNLRRFEDAHRDLRRVVLRRNYRSLSPVVQAAARLISHSAGPQAINPLNAVAHRRARRPAPVRSLCFATPDEETNGVATQLSDAIADGARPRDFAVLARSNGEIDAMARALRVRGVPVRTLMPADFFSRPEVRPLLAFLRVVADPGQTLELYTLANAAPYALGSPQLTEHLAQSRRRHRSLWEVLSELHTTPAADPDGFWSRVTALVDDVRAGVVLSHERSSGEVLYDYLRRSGRLARLARSGGDDEAGAVGRFFDIVRSRASLLANDRVGLLVPHLDALIEADNELSDTGPLDLDAVSVLTVHRAKGLQFRVVYLTGLTDGRFPARGRPAVLAAPITDTKNSPVDRLDEERRLCYVAMTRASDELWLTHHVAGPGGRGTRRASPFLAEALDLPATSGTSQLDPISQLAAWGQPVPETPRQVSAGNPAAVLSFSELETYLDCPERYRLRHVVGLPTPPHHAMAYGSALHHAVAAFHLARARGEQPTETTLLEAFRRAWSPEGYLSRDHEEARFAAGEAALRRFLADQTTSPSNVVGVERPFVFALDELRIRGRMDRIDQTPEGPVIVDYKSSDVRDQRKADERARNSFQLQVYAMAHDADAGALPHEVQLHFLDSGVVGRATPDAARMEKTREKLRSAAEGIRAGRFDPKPDRISCGYCPFRQICPSSAA
jgi:ATP-dependent DNA helicase UvrD/PcrA